MLGDIYSFLPASFELQATGWWDRVVDGLVTYKEIQTHLVQSGNDIASLLTLDSLPTSCQLKSVFRARRFPFFFFFFSPPTPSSFLSAVWLDWGGFVGERRMCLGSPFKRSLWRSLQQILQPTFHRHLIFSPLYNQAEFSTAPFFYRRPLLPAHSTLSLPTPCSVFGQQEKRTH